MVGADYDRQRLQEHLHSSSLIMEVLFHRPPEGFEYSMDSFNKSTKRIWIHNHSMEFSYREGKGAPKSIWGFYKPKTKTFYRPVTPDKMGKEVDIKDTTPYSAMEIKLNPLMSAFG